MKKVKYALIVIFLLVGAWILSSILSSQNKDDLRKPSIQTTEEKVILVNNEPHTFVLKTSGRMYAYNKVEIYAEVTGVLEESSSRFKPGQRFNKNDGMIIINSDVYLHSLLAKKSNFLNQLSFLIADAKVDFPDSYQKWENYLAEFDMQKKLDPLPKDLTKRETQYIASHNILTSYHEIKSMEATLDKYTIEAPYNGIVTESNINPGTLVRSGQKLGEFINTSLFEMAVPVKFEELYKISVGSTAILIPTDENKSFKGKIVRINSAIDQQTQTVQVYIQSTDNGILDGMFFNVEMRIPSKEMVSSLPIASVNEYNQVKIKSGNSTSMKDVKIIDRTVTHCLVSGLKDSTLVVVSGIDN